MFVVLFRGYSITAFGFLLLFGPVSIVASFRETMARHELKSLGFDTVRTIRERVGDVARRVAAACFGVAMLVGMIYMVIGAYFLVTKTDVFCNGYTSFVSHKDVHQWKEFCAPLGKCSAGACYCQNNYTGNQCQCDQWHQPGTLTDGVTSVPTARGDTDGDARCVCSSARDSIESIAGCPELIRPPYAFPDATGQMYAGNISALSMLPKLTTLTLHSDAVYGDVSSLVTLTHLTELNLRGTSVTGDAKQLQSLTRLQALDLVGTKVTIDGFNGTSAAQVKALLDFKTPGSATNATALSSWVEGSKPCPVQQAWAGITCGSVKIGNVDSKLVWSLVGLDVSGPDSEGVAGEVSKLVELVDLTILDLHGTSVFGDVSTLSALSELTSLDLHGASKVFGDVSKLATLQHLAYLDLSGTKVTGDAGALKDLPLLSKLDLSDTLVEIDGKKGAAAVQVSALSAFKASATAASWPVSSWTGIPCSGQPSWEGITCGSLMIGTVASNLKWNVVGLDLHGKAAVDGDVAKLAALTDLTSIDLHNTTVTGDAGSLAALSALTHLDLSGTKVTVGTRKAGTSDAQVSALLAFKGSGSAATKTALSSWSQGSNPCPGETWTGITCGSVMIGKVSSNLKWNVVGLDLHGKVAVDGDVAKLAKLVDITSLNLAFTGVTGDAGLLVRSLIDLKDLNVSGTGLKIGGGTPTEQVSALLAFKQSGTNGPSSWVHTDQSLQSDPCTDNWVGITCREGAAKKIGKLSFKTFNIIGLELTQLTADQFDADVAKLAAPALGPSYPAPALVQLESVVLSGTSVTGDAGELKDLSHLITLDLSSTKVTVGGRSSGTKEAQVAALSAFKASGRTAPAFLSSRGWRSQGSNPCPGGTWTGITCGSLMIGKVASNLKWNVVGLYLHGMAAAAVDGDVAKLAALSDLTSMDLHNTTVTGDAGSLAALSALTHLDLSGTKVTVGTRKAGTSDAQVSALLAFKGSGSAATKTALSSWSQGSNPCPGETWTGITCGSVMIGKVSSNLKWNVVGLDLHGMVAVDGDVATLAALEQLNTLALTGTQATGNAESLSALPFSSLDLSGTSVTVDGRIGGTPSAQVAALLAFKVSGGGGSETMLRSWANGRSPCAKTGTVWTGVTCSSGVGISIGTISSGLVAQNVVGIDLHGIPLAGDVSTLLPLVHLVSLDLSGTAVSGWPLVIPGGSTFSPESRDEKTQHPESSDVDRQFWMQVGSSLAAALALCMCVVFCFQRKLGKLEAHRREPTPQDEGEVIGGSSSSTGDRGAAASTTCGGCGIGQSAGYKFCTVS